MSTIELQCKPSKSLVVCTIFVVPIAEAANKGDTSLYLGWPTVKEEPDQYCIAQRHSLLPLHINSRTLAAHNVH